MQVSHVSGDMRNESLSWGCTPGLVSYSQPKAGSWGRVGGGQTGIKWGLMSPSFTTVFIEGKVQMGVDTSQMSFIIHSVVFADTGNCLKRSQFQLILEGKHLFRYCDSDGASPLVSCRWPGLVCESKPGGHPNFTCMLDVLIWGKNRV